MAIWEPHDTLSFFATGNRNVATDGTYIYIWRHCPAHIFSTGSISSPGGIYRYEPVGGTETLIISNTNLSTYLNTLYPVILLGHDHYSVGMICFNQEIYIAAIVRRYTDECVFAAIRDTLVIARVGVSSVTEVASITPGDVNQSSSTPSYANIWADSDNIVGMICITSVDTVCPGEDVAKCKYSGNGSSWSNVTVPAAIQGGFTSQEGRDFRSLGIYDYSSTAGIYKFSGGAWSVADASVDAGHSLYETGPTYHLTKTNGTGYAPADLSAYNTLTIPGFFSPARQLNMPWSMGYGFDSADEAYKLDGGAWVVLDTIDPGLLFDYTGGTDSDNWFIRMDSGECYMIKVTSGGGGSQVWKRDTDMAPTPDSWGGGDNSPCTNYAIMYYGIETPLVRGELPFCGVLPGALAVSVDGIAIIGGNPVNPTDSFPFSVVYAQAPYGDDDFVDTSGIVPLDTGVSSIKII